MQFAKLKEKLDKGSKIPNLLIFVGEEREVMLKYTKRVDENAVNVEDIETLPSKMLSGNLFANQNTYVVKDDKKILTWDTAKLRKLTKNHRLIILSKELDKRSKLAKEAKDYVVEFKKFDQSSLIQYIKGQIDVTDEVAMLIAWYCESEIARIDNEIDKLRHLNPEGGITEELLEELIVPPVEDAIFGLMDALMQGDKDTAFDIYTDLLALNESPIKVISLLYTKVRQTFLVQSMSNQDNKAIAASTGLTFWQVKMTRNAIGRFDDIALVEMMEDIVKREMEMKSGKVDIGLGMEDLLLQIL